MTTYTSAWKDELEGTIRKLLNRQSFSYDLNGDALYRQYKDRFLRQGKQAMEDTVGKASALTGGYGNSYAQTAGQQSYNQYLQGLNDMLPEFYQMAVDAYVRQGQDLEDRYRLLQDRETREYDRYQDTVEDYRDRQKILQEEYSREQDRDYRRYRDELEDRRYEEEWAYRQERDLVEDEQWLRKFLEDIRRYDQEWSVKYPWYQSR